MNAYPQYVMLRFKLIHVGKKGPWRLAEEPDFIYIHVNDNLMIIRSNLLNPRLFTYFPALWHIF